MYLKADEKIVSFLFFDFCQKHHYKFHLALIYNKKAMKYLSLILLLFFTLKISKAQTTKDFEKDFERIANDNFPYQGIDSLYKKYNHILFWFNSNSNLVAILQGNQITAYPLLDFKQTSSYKKNINYLLTDTAYRKYTLGCFLAGASGDTTKRISVENILIKSNYKHFWAATILTYLNPKDLNPILKCIITYKNNDGISYLMNDFLKIDRNVLEKFGYDSLFSNEPITQTLAIQALSKTPKSNKKETALKEVVLEADTTTKGWAIAVLAHLKAENMLPIVKPYLEIKNLQQVCLRAIASSGSIDDQKFIDKELAKDSISSNLLRELLASENKTSIKKWLQQFKANKFPKDYFVDIFKNVTIRNDEFFDEIVNIIRTNENEQQLYSLMSYFDGRKDERTIKFLAECSQHRFSSVSEKASQLLK